MTTTKLTLLAPVMILFGNFAISSASAQIGAPTSAPSNNWQSVVSSVDGMKSFAIVNPGTIYSSSDSGVTWNGVTDPQLSHLTWQAIATSADGTSVLAAPQSGWIYFSTNSAANWIRQTNLPVATWSAVALSANGKKLFAFSQQMYISSDSGATWSTNNLPFQYGAGAIVSADGNTLAFAHQLYPALIYTSTNAGAAWVTNRMPFYITGMASSADGTKMAVACLDGGIFMSTNSGDTWSVTTAPNIPWRAIASSADGKSLWATANNGGGGSIYSSTNEGADWVSNDVPSLHWSSLASSADGGRLFAAVSVYDSTAGPIFRFTNAPALRLDIQSSSGTSKLSWVIPSQPYSVQQSPDLLHWTDMSDIPTVNLNLLQNELNISLIGQNNFFRLRFE